MISISIFNSVFYSVYFIEDGIYRRGVDTTI